MEHVLHYADVLVLDHAYNAVVSALRFGATLTLDTSGKCALQHATAGAGELASNATVAGLTSAYLTLRDDTFRQLLSLFLITVSFGHVLYQSVATFSYYFIYDQNQLHHPRFLPNQIELEKKVATKAMGPMAAITVPWFFFEVRGYSKLYDNVDEYGWGWLVFSAFFFLFFTDMMIYWVHRALHHRLLYAPLHKVSSASIGVFPTPFASHAFNFMDGYLQSLAYHVFVYLFPLHKLLYLVMFLLVNMWTVIIHDGEYFTNDPIINGAAHHTVHHEQFNYNYGQYFTLWDRIGGTYRAPEEAVFERKMMLKNMLETQAKSTLTKTKSGKEQ
ncbi:hypothetical protein THASP1DRAFT_33969 [Thamnocephalis sphaerospora]|uniref:Fatty acid hydroxylase domain-containing protein n=1 Tax=Thamnocephalis sphaerospora TaxID=78915 RepID=A0A4P9XXZ7_9FUNG|nr:hypothetical protein THASP1DRAFT_33969 [Thamnocephalis sphaerospora]|eukprot:RKP10952.1 hypothetical protein THASP1DRAFT_33969 [Thamnocephalis sphaerospora]